MKNIQVKTIIVVVITLIGIYGTYYFFGGSTRKTPTNTKPAVELYSPIDIQNRIDHVIATRGEKYRKVSFGDERKFIVTYYQINRATLNSEDIEQRRRQQGILVFEEQISGTPKLFWESKDYIDQTLPILGLYDLTGDGVNEIVALWQNGRFERMFVYKYTNETFELMTPYINFKWPDGSTTKVLAFSTEDSLTKIFDVDKDGLPEITTPYRDAEIKNVYRAFKWDGSEYFLWKEQETPFTSEGRDEFSVVHVIDRLE